jgi:uncharacterized protein
LSLPTWDKPALACLSSRIPHGTPITLESLSQVDQAEAFLKTLGVGQVRVRHHGDTASIEVEPGDFAILRPHQEEIARELGRLGFRRVLTDPNGYRPASLSERATNRPLHLIKPLSPPVLAK